MHMADALVSPAVGGTMWAATAGLTLFSAARLRGRLDDRRVPMMGVMGAFVFAAQMINFTIPATGSSGHIGGALLLTILLGQPAAFITIASVLCVQALFFADGGLLALGCNIFNLGFFPACIAYPLLYRPIAAGKFTGPRAWLAAIVAAVVGLQLGALGVVLQTTASGISELPFKAFLGLMLPIHLAIGVVEGLATAAVVAFVASARPQALATDNGGGSVWPALGALALAAVLLGGVVSWFASQHEDGLEWSIAKVAGSSELAGAETSVHKALAGVQERTAILPDYEFRSAELASDKPAEAWPAVSAGKSVSGIVGGLVTLLLAVAIGYALNARSARSAQGSA